jgi:hypothetical protein
LPIGREAISKMILRELFMMIMQIEIIVSNLDDVRSLMPEIKKRGEEVLAHVVRYPVPTHITIMYIVKMSALF